ncbi:MULTISPECIES: hypothetical protein [unclassified Sinorhizobium]|uniref:hypothetical protein n=1 Tax=unclassified Sinorhizobium TaxID=2613772 RepID=UPI003525765F
MAKKQAIGPIIGAVVVLLIALAIGYWIQTNTDTAPSVPPDRQNTEDRLPAGPGSPGQLPGSQ